MSDRHGNFRDPVGLVRRMLASGKPAAMFSLVREVARYLLKPLDWALAPWEGRRIRRGGPGGKPIVLIVGAPRSGSTLLYQVLAAHLPVSYPSNLTDLFSRAPITATARLGRFARRKLDYRFHYGNTASLGAPSAGFSLWNRWLGADRYRVPSEMAPGVAADMRAFFAAWETAFEGPFLCKNNRNTAGIGVLATELPNAKFIVIRRDPLFVAQSLLEAREHVQGDRAVGWGLGASPHPSEGDHLAEVADQVFGIESLVQEAIAHLDPARVLELGYAELCADPTQIVARVAGWLDLAPKDLDELTPFVSTDQARLGGEEFARLGREIRTRFPSQ
ncbi:MAG: sulfotransferase [Acidimicrobiia bacterium]|nr:sulfotransferase [Acidimicrobiia bacterium]